jgi:hypothetical protein
MPNVAHIATIAAYPIKEELGGGFRGVFKNVGEDRVPSDRFDTLEEAKFWAQDRAWKAYNCCSFAPYKLKGEYKANVWVNV